MAFRPWMNDRFDNPSLAMVEASPAFLMDHPDGFELAQPGSVAAWFPPDLEFALSDDSGPGLADSIPNLLTCLIASTALKDLLVQHSGTRLEVYPVRLRNARGRPVEAPYFLVHVTEAVACMDMAKSEFRMSSMIRTQVDKLRRLVLDESRIPEGKSLFRMAEMPDLLLVRDSLADILKSAGMTGMLLPSLDDWNTKHRCKT